MGAAVVSNSKLAKVVAPALDKVVKNAAWRKHGKLVQDCKAVMDKFASLPEAASPHPPPAPTTAPAEATSPDAKDNSTASSDEPTASPVPNENEGPLFDDGKCLTAAESELILLPLFEACDTLATKVVEPALDCIQKLIAHGRSATFLKRNRQQVAPFRLINLQKSNPRR
ncbi:hypothetical protein R1sor_012228 [Riccia sorocarpa]|uniref:Mon2/Sec7/BIG1-like dimerisation and cyclophilin-binding domain-containing protein n=1 Tax=Riccia sorocarpa TaxID=122646 RepID=A0ABD3I5X1_9MARC